MQKPNLVKAICQDAKHMVLIHITHYDERRKLIYARILGKW